MISWIPKSIETLTNSEFLDSETTHLTEEDEEYNDINEKLKKVNERVTSLNASKFSKHLGSDKFSFLKRKTTGLVGANWGTG